MNDIKDFVVSMIIVFAIWAAATGAGYMVNILVFSMVKKNQADKQWKTAAKSFGVRVSKLKKMTKAEIKKMYRKLVMKHHPDKGGNPDKFRDLHDAYEFAYAAS